MDGEGGCFKTPHALLDTPSHPEGPPAPPQGDPSAHHSPICSHEDRAQGGVRSWEGVQGWIRLSTGSACPQHWPPTHRWLPDEWASGSQAFTIRGDLPEPPGDSQGSVSQCFSASYVPARGCHPETKAPLEMSFLVLSSGLPTARGGVSEDGTGGGLLGRPPGVGEALTAAGMVRVVRDTLCPDNLWFPAAPQSGCKGHPLRGLF